jgi:hypothetical protein
MIARVMFRPYFCQGDRARSPPMIPKPRNDRDDAQMQVSGRRKVSTRIQRNIFRKRQSNPHAKGSPNDVIAAKVDEAANGVEDGGEGKHVDS